MNKEESPLIQFIREEIGEYQKEISLTTTIEDDLGVTGDEAIDLIKKFSKRFSIDINTLKFEKYFYPEPSIFKIFNSVTLLTIGDLERAIISGKLE